MSDNTNPPFNPDEDVESLEAEETPAAEIDDDDIIEAGDIVEETTPAPIKKTVAAEQTSDDEEPQALFGVGIDLGTTNCAIASVALDAEEGTAPSILGIPQVAHLNEVRALPLLPSFIYLPSEVEMPEGAIDLPWEKNPKQLVGSFARERGTSSPSRLVSSAKSWLSYGEVDRREPILPWNTPPHEVEKISPLEASRRFLEHMRQAWDLSHPDHPLKDQDLVITVPASFDAVARELTVQAAKQADLGDFRLLEEPQAALYAWVADRSSAWRKEVSVGDTILVCDIGGGTTDFSLIAVGEENGSLQLERVAVGDHILLGGDNMDLALAFAVYRRLESEGQKLDDWQIHALTHSCRVAKEALFSDPTRDTHPLVIPGRGSRLIGGTIRTTLSRQELNETLLEGFFPIVDVTARPQKSKLLGLRTLGLPYAHDPAMTCHLAYFLSRQRHPAEHSFLHPTAILFNGGVTRSPIIRDRIIEQLSMWIELEGGEPPKVLQGVDPEMAVARGAAYYARARAKGGVRIKGGTAQSYYIGIERSGLAVPGMAPRVDALCIAPFGMEEGSDAELPKPLGLVVGEPASFRFFSSSSRRQDRIGDLTDPDELTELAPIEATLEGEPGHSTPVRLHAHVTEIGTLDLSLEEYSGRRWQLSFNVRVE